MIIFDILATHHRMTVWHDTTLDRQMASLAKLRQAHPSVLLASILKATLKLMLNIKGGLTLCRDAKRACHARIRRQPSIRKRLSLDATLAMADIDLPVLTQDLISSAVSFSPSFGIKGWA